MKGNTSRRTAQLLELLAALALLCGFASGQNMSGVITGRTGATMTMQTQALGNMVVILTPATEVRESEGLLRCRKKEMGVTALIPGLQVQVQGSYNAQNQLIANTITFSGSSLKTAEDIQAGVTPVEQQAEANQQQIRTQQQQLQQQQQQLVAEQQQTAANQQQTAANQARIAANKAAIAEDNKRFGELADYNILGEATVYFANGSTEIAAQYKPELLQLTQKAMGITGYVLQIQGYASAVGSAALNQRLSTERAANVTEFLEQQANVPLTNMLAPGAMGTSRQVASDATAEGQAENRRVVVRILQNKGVAGT